MTIGTILAIVAAYVVIAVLLLSLNLTSRWRWWIKGTAIVVTGGFFVASYFAIVSLLGWPASDVRLPSRFSLVATYVVEPNAFTGDPGAIYLWLEEIDEDNFIISEPRAFRLAYVEPLADAADDAQAMLNEGEQVQGEVRETEQEGEEGEAEAGTPGEGAGTGGPQYPVEFTLIFNDMPPVALPDKGAL